MQKISGILPNTPRIAAVDMRDGHAARPGGPTFGRPEGTSGGSKHRPTERTTAQLASQKHNELLDVRTKSQKDADIVRRISDGFFMRKLDPPKPVIHDEFDFGALAEPTVNAAGQQLYQDPESGEMVEGEVMPPGTYLNVSA